MSSGVLEIPCADFKVLPANLDAGISTIEAFIFTETTLPVKIDPKCDCLTSLDDLDWISYDQTLKTINIQTTSKT